MQACKLRIGEASPSQVSKAQLDVPSHRAAFLLADSSCLLFPSLPPGTSPPFLIPPRCSDICFLRLRERTSNPTSSSSSDKSAETAARSDPAKHPNAKARPFEDKSGNAMEDAGSGAGFRTMAVPVGNAVCEADNDIVMFLVVKPAKWGSGTDVIAWKCCGLQFMQASLSFEDFRNVSTNSSHSSSTIARFHDIPHGSFVGISASINVITLYSPATGKVWILSAKLTSRDQDCDRTAKSAIQGQLGTPNCLQLIKCAVLECSGPVYDLHLSFQHLLIGQFGGVRVWSLRPLIKRRVVSRKRSFIIDANAQNKEEQFKCGKSQQETNVDVKRSGTSREFVEHYSATQENVKCEIKQELSLARAKNGFHETTLLANGFVQLGLNKITSSSFKVNNGEEKIEFHGCYCAKNSSGHTITNENMQSISRQNGDLFINGAGENSPEYRMNIMLADPAEEELHSQLKISQSSGISSSSAASSVPTLYGTHKTVALSSSCQSLTSSGSETCVEKEHSGHGIKEGTFIPFFCQMQPMETSESFLNGKKDEQAISMHKLSEREYLILDSQGKLHILALQHIVSGGDMKLQQNQALSHASMQHLQCAIKIRVLAVLPVDPTAERSRSHANRVIWVSDGNHTVYVMRLASRNISKDQLKKNSADSIKNFTVIHTIFTTDRIISLSALSGNSVLVQTEGSMVAYSLNET